MNNIPKTLPRLVWHFLRRYQRWMVLSIICGLVWAVENSITPYILKYIIDTITEYTGDRAELWTLLALPVALYGLFWMIRAGTIRVSEFASLKTYPRMKQDITVEMFDYLKQHSHQFFQDHFAGSLQSKVSDMAEGATAVVRKLEEALAQCILVLVAITTMALVHPLFAGVLALWLTSFVLVAVFFSKSIQVRSKDYSESRSRHVGKIVDSISNVLNTRLFAHRAHEVQIVKDAVGETTTKDVGLQSFVLRMRALWDITFIALMAGMLTLLVTMYIQDKVTIGDFTFVMGLSRAVVFPVWWLATQMIEFSSDVGKCQQALSIVTAPHSVTDAPDAKQLKAEEGAVSFQNVSFNYQKASGIFHDVSVEITAGQKVGLVGASGAGKSTFVNLLLRYYDVNSGQILVDGENINHVTQDSLRESISMIPQDTSLFHRSLIENIRYGKLEATEQQVIAAAQKAHCHEFIQELPEGYDSLVGERGIKLSGGQRQRIAIARAILKDAPILILDEATSALDSVTEKYIQQGLENLMENRTAIVIAHRLSTLAQMDRILVFDKGRVIESGTHDELLAQKGHYAQMWSMQAGGFLTEEVN